jgi:hypothetical protein
MDLKDLVGKTIKSATQLKFKKYDDDGFLLSEFTDRSRCLIESAYGGYTGESYDEYPSRIGIYKEDDEDFSLELLIPVVKS